MSDEASTGDDESVVRSLLRDEAGVVLVAAIVLAVALGLGVAPVLFEAASFYVLVLVGVLIPVAYRQWWPHRYEPRNAILWTVLASVVTMVLFWAGYYVAEQLLERSIDVASAAFVFTAIGQVVVLRRAARSSRPTD